MSLEISLSLLAQLMLKTFWKIYQNYSVSLLRILQWGETEPQNPDFCPDCCKWTWWPQRWGTSWQITMSHSCPFSVTGREKVLACVCQLKILWSLTQNRPWLWASVSPSENFDLAGFEHCKMDIMSSYCLRRGCESEQSERGNRNHPPLITG